MQANSQMNRGTAYVVEFNTPTKTRLRLDLEITATRRDFFFFLGAVTQRECVAIRYTNIYKLFVLCYTKWPTQHEQLAFSTREDSVIITGDISRGESNTHRPFKTFSLPPVKLRIGRQLENATRCWSTSSKPIYDDHRGPFLSVSIAFLLPLTSCN